MKLVDVRALEARARKGVWVRVPQAVSQRLEYREPAATAQVESLGACVVVV